MARNFYGVLRVRDELSANQPTERELLHGTINHGSQVLDENFATNRIPITGPIPASAARCARCRSKGPVRVGVIGLGAGVLNAYAAPATMFRVYEINPLVERIAQTEFTLFPALAPPTNKS